MGTREVEIYGLRKGFATSLQQRDVPQVLMAYAGRWTLMASVYKYICHTLGDMKDIAKEMWDKYRETLEHIDLDVWEVELLKDTNRLKDLMLK